MESLKDYKILLEICQNKENIKLVKHLSIDVLRWFYPYAKYILYNNIKKFSNLSQSVVLNYEKKRSRLGDFYIPLYPILLPKNIGEIIIDCYQNDNWRIKEIINISGSIITYKVCKFLDCTYTLKEQPLSKDFLVEVQTLINIEGLQKKPKLYSAWICNKKGYYVLKE